MITGEGRFDDQSLHGKVVGALAEAARSRRIPVVVLAGQVELDRLALRSAGILAAFAIADYAGSVRLALADAANQLMGLASQVAARLGNRGSNKVPLKRWVFQRGQRPSTDPRTIWACRHL